MVNDCRKCESSLKQANHRSVAESSSHSLEENRIRLEHRVRPGGPELSVSRLVRRNGWGISQPVSPREIGSDTTRSVDTNPRPDDVG